LHRPPELPHPPLIVTHLSARLGVLPLQTRLPHMAARHDVTANQSAASSPARCYSKLPTGGRDIGSGLCPFIEKHAALLIGIRKAT